MARKHVSNPVKMFTLPANEVDDAKAAADFETNGSVSALGRDIIESFLHNGTEYTNPGSAPIQVHIDPELVQRAEQKARDEHGVGLREIVRFELAKRAVRAHRAARR